MKMSGSKSKRHYPSRSQGIGTMQERSLHAALKEWYAQPGDRFEVFIDGHIVDIVRDDLLIEIQTRHFASIRRKLAKLITDRRVRLVYPIAQDKWIARMAADGITPIGRRRSPKRGEFRDIFHELVRLPKLMVNPNLSLEILLIQEEEIRHDDGQGSWRRKGWSIADRKLLAVLDRRILETPADFRQFLPKKLPRTFSTRDIAESLDCPRRFAQLMAYCLREMGTIRIAGKEGNAILYKLVRT